MKKDFYTDDFEQLLKDTTDDFRMYPSRKVWHSIYNDLHPDRKWPSFAVCLLLITSILFIGIHNNNTINADAENLFLSSLTYVKHSGSYLTYPPKSSVKNEKSVASELEHKNFAAVQGLKKHGSSADNFSTIPINVSKSPSENITERTISDKGLTVKLPVAATEGGTETESSAFDFNPSVINQSTGEEKIPKNEVAETAMNELKPEHKEQLLPTNLNKTFTIYPVLPGDGIPESLRATTNSQPVQVTKTRDAEEAMWVEDYAFHNKRNNNKWKTKLSTVVYLTPSVGYRILEKNNNFEPVNALLIRSSATTVDAEDAITQQAALNIESGVSVLMALAKKLKAKAGVQINYTNYISYAQQLYHPTQTNVLLNDLNTGNTLLVPFRTMYGNKPGDNLTKLKNKTIQFSLPIGADYQLAGNDKLKWYIGATIQPTYVASGNAYLVSADYKNYVEMPSMLRTWNVNAGFESFISYKTKNGSYINLGPQFRYQLMSTYSHQYTYSENLYNIGLKVGIMRKL